MTFDGKTVLITGASTGIGKAIAQRLLKQNCNLILIARRAELIEQYLRESPITNNQPLVLRSDVSKKEEVAVAYEQIKQKLGGVDIAILNSGVGRNVTVETYNSKDAEDTFGANVFGIIYWVEQLLPDFLKKKNGVIAAVSSLADNRGFSGSGFYCASKAAATTYLEGLRVELKPHNIKVITIRPGFVRTPMTDQNNFKMPLLMEPEKAAEIILCGIEKEKRVIQFPWQIYLATRIIGALPGRVYEWLAGKAKV
ncbi:MAG: SDR family NAD(P)-dependent oxidoreductase [Ignavibacteria bacterium]|nr:SDR family NAD(P)-dependent oxidoreductase [Ignavibacteria bacterium]